MSFMDFLWRGPTVTEADIDPNDNDRALPPPPTSPVKAERAVSAAADISTYQHGRATYPTFTASNAVASGMRLSVYAYRCIRLISESAASLPWKVQRKVRGEWKDVEYTHPLLTILEKPNEHWSRADLIGLISMHLDLAGRAFVSKVRLSEGLSELLGGSLVELWALNPDKVTPIKSRTHYIEAFEHTQGDSTRKRYDPEDICHIRLVDPADPHNGLGPTEAAAYPIDTEVEAAKWQKNQLKNDCRPGGVYMFDKHLSKSQRASAEETIEDRFKGGANAGRTLVLGGGGKYARATSTPVEMDHIQSRKANREEICSGYGVPPVLVGILDRATYSNFETALEVFWQLTMVPRMGIIGGALNRSLVPEYGDPSTLRIVPDYSGIPQLNSIDRNTVLSVASLHRVGVPFNALNNRFGLGFPNLEYGDTSYLAAGRPLDEEGIPVGNADAEGADVAEGAIG